MTVQHRLRRVLSLAAMLIATIAAPQQLAAQCGEQWLPGQGSLTFNPSASVHIETVGEWSPAGGAPLMVVGGEFLIARSRNIAVYEDSSWRPLGEGFSGRVLAIHNHEGDLIAGGEFTHSGTTLVNRVARWNGNSWLPMGDGLPAKVVDLASWNGELIALSNRVYRWTGTQWQALSSEDTSSGQALGQWLGDLLVAGGAQLPEPFLARWDGTTWHSMGINSGSYLADLAVFQEDLYTCGYFNIPGVTSVQGIARWDGAAWQQVGSTSGEAMGLAVHDGELCVVGSLSGTGAHGIVQRWDGNQWHPTMSISKGLPRGVASSAGRLVVTGPLQTGSYPWFLYDPIMYWTGSNWGPLAGEVGGIATFQTTDDGLAAGGGFTAIGEQRMLRAARWDGIQWHTMGGFSGGGTQFEAPSVGVSVTFDGSVVMGGLYLARWDGSGWASVGGPSHIGSLSASPTHMYAVSYSPWGSGLYRSTGNGVWDAVLSTAHLHSVFAHDGQVLLSGEFNSIAGTPAQRIASFDGSAWHPMGAGVNGFVYRMLDYEGDAIIAGDFTTAGGQPVGRIARWDGAAWHPLGAGMNGLVGSLAVYNGDLIAGGGFSMAGAVPAAGIARWDGDAWRPLGTAFMPILGTSVAVHAMVAHKSELIVSGNFATAGGHLSTRFARWTDTGAPWVAHHPADQHSTTGAQVQFTAAAARGYENLSWQWRRNGVPLSDGITHHSSMIAGSTTPTLTITNIQPADIGSYDVVLANACGDDTSNAAILSLDGACYPNCDGSSLPPVLNIDDFTCFINEFAAAQSLPPAQQITAYANCDASTIQPILNVDDFTCFITAFAIGCP